VFYAVGVERKDRRRTSTDARIELRRQVIELRATGKTLAEISAITGYAKTYCSTLCRQLHERPEGLDSLSRGGRPPGVKRALSRRDEQKAQLLICGKFPEQLQLPFALWTRAAVRELIRVRFDVRLSVRAVGDYLARWGYTPQKAARRAYERDDAAVRAWLRHEYPALVRRAKREGAEISWGDETGIRSDESRHRGFAPKGQTPVIRIPARRRSLSLLAAVTNQGKVRFMIYKGALSPKLLIVFLRRLTKAASRKVFLILDNLRVHKATEVREWIGAHRKAIEVFFLPPYSPELNPTEYFNGDLKGTVQRDIPARNELELKRKLLAHSRSIQKSPARVRKYFEHESIRYAA
jgi:transposase